MSKKRELYLMVPARAREEAEEWWGCGGAELVDELDPECTTENQTDRPEAVIALGPFDPVMLAQWWERARIVPGWCFSGIRVMGRTVMAGDLEVASSDIPGRIP